MLPTLANSIAQTTPDDPVFATWADAFYAWGEILWRFWLIPLTSFVVAATMTPIVRRIALSRGIVDKPDEFLKPHGRPIPYLGGVAIFAGWVAAILLALFMTNARTTNSVMVGIALAADRVV